MLERTTIHEPTELLLHDLGSALTMEDTIVEMLQELQQEARTDEVRDLLRHHEQQTLQQVENVKRAFEALGAEPERQGCPPIEGIEKQGRTTIKKTEDELNDAVILAGAGETEHFEIAVYENLITHAEAMGHEDVVVLLRENLEQEEQTLRDVTRLAVARAAEHAAAA